MYAYIALLRFSLQKVSITILIDTTSGIIFILSMGMSNWKAGRVPECSLSPGNIIRDCLVHSECGIVLRWQLKFNFDYKSVNKTKLYDVQLALRFTRYNVFA